MQAGLDVKAVFDNQAPPGLGLEEATLWAEDLNTTLAQALQCELYLDGSCYKDGPKMLP